MATFTEHLRRRGDAGLTALLGARPDLAVPPPSTLRSLAARAANRLSLDRALAGVDAQVLAVLEAVLALEPTPGHEQGVPVSAVTRALGEDLTASIDTALGLALLWTDSWSEASQGPAADGPVVTADLTLHAAPGLDEVLGPYPAGLGPTLASTLGRRTPAALAALADEVGPAPADRHVAEPVELLSDLIRHLADPQVVDRLLSDGPPGARAVLAALTWGPPVGRSAAPAVRSPRGEDGAGEPSTTPAGTAVEWLLRHGLLAVGDPQHVVLPREVALVLRDGRTHREPTSAPRPAGAPVDPQVVDAESVRHAEEMVRLVAALVERWGRDQPAVLRSGGLGSRDLRRLATVWDVPDQTAAFVVEVAGAARLVADDGEDPPSFTPTAEADEWLGLPLPERWQRLAEAWLAVDRAAWLVGTRDERGALRAALDPESRRPWAPRLRTAVLEVLDTGEHAERLSTTPAEVHAVLRWRTPRAAPALHAVEAVVEEAQTLGLVAAGTITSAGRALLHETTADGVPVPPTTDDATIPSPAAVLADLLPPAVDEVLLQGDLTGIVPGRPSPALADLLDRSAQVESRGAGLTVRFTEGSVRSALDSGRPAESLLAELSRHARSGVPQPLEYLVLDVARRHGQVRVGMASSYLRADDPTLLAGLVEDKALRGLGLLQLAPTVIAAQVPASTLVAALRARGLSPVTEDPGGSVVLSDTPPRRVRPGRGGRRPPAAVPPGISAEAEAARRRRLARLAAELLREHRREAWASASDAGSEADAAGAASDVPVIEGVPAGPPRSVDPILALDLLREAATEGREVWLEMVGAGGTSTRRKVRPVRVDAGRVRVIDAERESEMTIAVHRIGAVTPA